MAARQEKLERRRQRKAKEEEQKQAGEPRDDMENKQENEQFYASCEQEEGKAGGEKNCDKEESEKAREKKTKVPQKLEELADKIRYFSAGTSVID